MGSSYFGVLELDGFAEYGVMTDVEEIAEANGIMGAEALIAATVAGMFGEEMLGLRGGATYAGTAVIGTFVTDGRVGNEADIWVRFIPFASAETVRD